MKLFSVSYLVGQGDMAHHATGWVISDSREAAVGAAYEKCLEMFPAEEGHYSHSVVVAAIPVETFVSVV